MSKQDKSEAVRLTLSASMPISERTEGIHFDNQVTFRAATTCRSTT